MKRQLPTDPFAETSRLDPPRRRARITIYGSMASGKTFLASLVTEILTGRGIVCSGEPSPELSNPALFLLKTSRVFVKASLAPIAAIPDLPPNGLYVEIWKGDCSRMALLGLPAILAELLRLRRIDAVLAMDGISDEKEKEALSLPYSPSKIFCGQVTLTEQDILSSMAGMELFIETRALPSDKAVAK